MLGSILVVFLSFVGFYRLWYVRRVRSGIKKIMADLPPSNQLSWNVSKHQSLANPEMARTPAFEILPPESPSTDHKFEPGQDRRHSQYLHAVATDPVTWASAADGAVTGWSILESSLRIDPQVLSAMEFSTAQDLHGLADIDTYVQDHFFAVPIESADGWFGRLTGYVAEQKAASFFEQTGHHVIMAPVSNQPVWDMLVDGHPVQIKEHLAGLKDFAVAHPDIPAFTNLTDAATVHSSSVHGLEILDKDSIHGATLNTIDGLDGTFDPGFHFPVVTLAFSAYREARLLIEEHTTWDRALVHIGMDVTGVGGGALLGAKLGALAGSIVPGPGTVVGGMVGSIVGGIAGKMACTGARRLPFLSAREDYNKTVESAQSSIEAAISDSQRRVRDLQQDYQSRFQEVRSQIETRAKQNLNSKKIEYESKLVDFCNGFPGYLQELQEQLESEEREVLSTMPIAGFFSRAFPTEVALQRRATAAWFRRARGVVGKELDDYRRLSPGDVYTLFRAVERFRRDFRFELNSLKNRLSDLSEFRERQRRAAEEIRRGSLSELGSKRESLVRGFGFQVTSLHQSIVENVQSWNRRISSARDDLRRQALAVGIHL